MQTRRRPPILNFPEKHQDHDDDQYGADETDAAMAITVACSPQKRPLKPPNRKITSKIITISPIEYRLLFTAAVSRKMTS